MCDGRDTDMTFLVDSSLIWLSLRSSLQPGPEKEGFLMHAATACSQPTPLNYGGLIWLAHGTTPNQPAKGIPNMSSKPWQIVPLSTLLFIQTAHLIPAVAAKVLTKADHGAVEAMADLGHSSGGGVEAVYEYLGTQQFILTAVAVVSFMFGFLLYRGESLPAVRLTGFIFFAVSVIGQAFATIPRGSAAGTVLDETISGSLTFGLVALIFVGFISLFFGKSGRWVKENSKSA